MSMKYICGNALIVCGFLIGCSETDPISRTAQSLIPQLYSGMSLKDYKALKYKYYPPIGGGIGRAENCFVGEDETQQCNDLLFDTTIRLTYSFSKQQVVANCETYQCFPTNLSEVLEYDSLSGNTPPIADRIQAGLVEWGTWRGGEEIYIFFDNGGTYLVGVMVMGELDIEPFHFIR